MSGCTCSAFILQYEGGCVCGWEDSRTVTVKLSGSNIDIDVVAKLSKPATIEERVHLTNQLLTGLENHDASR